MIFSRLRLQLFVGCIFALLVYAGIHWTQIEVRLKGEGAVFFLAFGLTMLAATYFLAPSRWGSWIGFALIAPYFASVLGYLVLAAKWSRAGGMTGSLLDVLVVALVSPYFACFVWAFSLYLLLFLALIVRFARGIFQRH